LITGAETAHLAGRPAAIYLEGRLPVVVASIARELGLSNGQVIEAKAQANGAGWTLQLPGQLLEWPRELPSSWRLASGDTLLFRVQLQNDGSVVLRPIATATPIAPAPAPALAPTPPPAEVHTQPLLPDRSLQLAHRPPDPAALTQLLQPASLDQLLQQARSLNPELATSLHMWMRQRPSMAQLTPDRIQQLLLQGGWMTEALLAQGQGAGLVDFKSTLRGLLRALGNSASETRAHLQDALDDIESRQLQASDRSPGKEWAISMVLPFVDASPVQVRMSWQRPEGEQPSRFMLQLHTTSADLGDLWLQSQILNLSEVELVMWADREDVARRAQARSASLAEELDSAGLHMSRLQVIHGRRPESTHTPWGPPASGSMVDVAT